MDALFSLLLFTAFVFAVMRLASGSSSHHHSPVAGQPQPDPSTGHLPEGVDPICGRLVPANDGFLAAHDGIEYRLCSLACVEHLEVLVHSRRQKVA